MDASDNENEEVASSRRTFLRNATMAAGAAGAVAAFRGVEVNAQVVPRAPASPRITPFVDELPIQTPAVPVAWDPATGTPPLDPPPDFNQHERLLTDYDAMAPKKYYDFPITQTTHQFHRDMPPSTVWAYNGQIPGPLFVERYGTPVMVRWRNQIPNDATGFGVPSIVTHLHNLHVASRSDGYTLNFADSGQYWDHHYPNVYAGYDQYRAIDPVRYPIGDPREALGTLWYHDHRLDFTAPNVYRGLSGFYLLYDNIDSGNERDTNPAALRLPSGKYDIPIAIQDRRFSANGELFFNQFDLDGFIGDRYVVNGKIQPFFKVERRKYRFRILSGGPSRFLKLALSTGAPIVVIGKDGNLLPAPIQLSQIELAVAERIDIIIDFARWPTGTQLYLVNHWAHSNGKGPSGDLRVPDQIMRFDVGGLPATPDVSRIPARLRELPPINMNEVVANRTWAFGNGNGAWTVNSRVFDPAVINAVCTEGTAEIWTLVNNGGGWAHPIHIHFEEFRVLSRTRKGSKSTAPLPEETGRCDVMRLDAGESATIFIRFRDFTGKYMMHCHNGIHEDHAMMVHFEIVKPGQPASLPSV